jgi:hypothetical protein
MQKYSGQRGKKKRRALRDHPNMGSVKIAAPYGRPMLIT